VKDGGEVIDNLNELEFVKGEIYANIWHSDRKRESLSETAM
jgi:glutamine cyclotransferase